MNTPDTECGCTNKKYCTKHFNEAVRKDHPTPDTELDGIVEEFMWQMKGDQHNICGQYIPAFCDKQEKRLRALLSSRDTYWKERVQGRNATVKEYKDEGVMFVLKVEDGKTYEASMPIPKWGEVGKLEFRDTLLDNLK